MIPDNTFNAKEYKVICLRETVTPDSLFCCDQPKKAADYWDATIKSHPFFNPGVECLVVLMLNTRKKVIGHNFVSVGTVDSCMAHPREVFRAAIVATASSIVLIHNHPSGDATPSEADILVTKTMIRAGQLLKIEVLDHVIMGVGKNQSLRELGYCYT